MSLISIITPLYNSKNYISETINSVLEQDYDDWEYILVDDCSTDGTVEYIKNKYTDVRIKIVESPLNSGAGAARNLGLKNASGRYIAFLDSDDIWGASKLGKQIRFMSENNYPIVHTSYSFVNDEGNKIPGRVNVSKEVSLQSYMRNTEIGMSTALIDKKLVGDFSLSTMRTRQDTKLWLSLLSLGFKSYGLDENLVLYRIRQGQISGNKFVIAFRTLRLYLTVHELPLYSRVFNFFCYSLSGLSKRLKR